LNQNGCFTSIHEDIIKDGKKRWVLLCKIPTSLKPRNKTGKKMVYRTLLAFRPSEK
jgi:hypothetical protein